MKRSINAGVLGAMSLLCELLMSGAWAQAQTPAESSTPPVQPAVIAPQQAAPDSAVKLPSAAPGVGPDYVIGPGDVVDVFVWRNPELSTSVPVRPDGKISSPLVSEVVATGKTAVQLGHDIEAILSDYIRAPQVNVIVRSAMSASSQIRVVGQAASPKAIPYRDGITVLDVVIAVGGLSEFAAGNRAKIVRAVPGGKAQEIHVKLKKLMEGGDMSQNYPMRPGDVLVIPGTLF